MAFASFLGRVLFASVFILSAYQEFNEFGVDGGPAAKALRPKFDAFTHHVHSQVGFQLSEIDTKLLIAGAIALKGLGGVLFILGSSFGALLLLLHQLIATPIVYDFYNYESEDKEFTQLFIKFTQATQEGSKNKSLLVTAALEDPFPWSGGCCFLVLHHILTNVPGFGLDTPLIQNQSSSRRVL
ncbi:unnamed protein product [Sphenostylis stenocarpa]|uniref:HR-like lesion-inducer n=1 Tax=Sphenostylis stenocarpa TaxID=92480 RepID=A0AA86SPG3_9FABA|nr:unnamed protein product [Sphenostylis stenocarpa]